MFFLKPILKSEIGGGLVLMGSAVIALLWANTPAAPIYFDTLKTYVFGLSVLHWVNDGLMAIFFLLVGLEIKRELVTGQLATARARALPGFAALGGMVVPALVYVAFNTGSPEHLRGWAIPAATDIAFSLGVLALLGPRVPVSLKVFLTALAILDDLGAVIIIALFYTADMSVLMIGLSALVLALLIGLNLARVRYLTPYLILGAFLWYFVLQSGVHATIAGVLLALTIPIQGKRAECPLHRLEHGLQPWVTFLVLPIFGLANAGVAFAGLGADALFHPVTLGVALGLFIGKQVGIFACVRLVVALGLAERPHRANWMHVYGVAILCGIGFTMSLFIGLLAFASPELQNETKIGVLVGSAMSAVLGFVVLRFAGSKEPRAPE
jgi:NhaA family Na+:H+ antiporter